MREELHDTQARADAVGVKELVELLVVDPV